MAIYDAAGRPVGTASRTRMRAEGLWHAATAVLVRSTDAASVFVHRRTDTKDVYPGLHDCWAGGVVAAHESPDEGARRELREELGVEASPTFVFRTVHRNAEVRFHAFVYEVFCDGPFTVQDEEVAEGWWMPLSRLCARLRDPSWPFVPDGRQFFDEWLVRHHTGAEQTGPDHTGPG